MPAPSAEAVAESTPEPSTQPGPATSAGNEPRRRPLARPPAGRPRRLAFLGTPPVAADILRGLGAAGFDVGLVVSRADTRRGRGGATSPSPVKAAALEMGIPVTHRPADVVGAGVDLGVVVAYGALIRRPVLEEVAMVNVHFSLLPRWRGAAPVERAILAGDDRTGVCLMALEEGLDTGPVYRTEEVPIGPGDTAEGLRRRLGEVGGAMLTDELGRGLGTPVPQEGEATYASKLSPDELRLDWERPAAELDRVVRAGRAWTTFRGKRLLVLAARPDTDRSGPLEPGRVEDGVAGTAEGGLVLVTVQPEGRAPLPAADWARGARPGPSDRLGC